MVFLLEKRHLERKNGKQFVDVALDVLDTMLLPRPYLWRDVIIDRNICLRFYIFCNLQIETRIIDQDHTVRLPIQDIPLAHAHITEYHRQMEKYGDKSHISQFSIMPDPRTTDGRHQIAAEETKLGGRVNFFQRTHQMRCM